MRKYLSNGFTLVELLIVIALLGIIATIVIAAINPIEQANRAADAGMKADASQIVSAIERYYASHNIFPWNDASCSTNGGSQCLNGQSQGPDSAFNFISADDASVGICGATGTNCKTSGNQGALISGLELQKTFLNKSWIGNSSDQNKLWVGKGQGASAGVFVCWSPKANSNRQVLIASQASGQTNRMWVAGSGATLSTTTGLPSQASTCTLTSSSDWTTGKCVECVPE